MLVVILYTVSSILAILLLLKLYCWLTIAKCDRDDDMAGKTVLITGASAGTVLIKFGVHLN